MEGGSCGRSPVSLLPRLGRLDALMNYLEKKHNSLRCSNGVFLPIEKRSIPLDSAIQEAHAKGSVLDRIESLEHRLAQISLEMEGSSVSSPSTVHTPESTPARQAMSNREETPSFQSFDDLVIEHQEDSSQQRYSTELVSDQQMARSSLIEPRQADQNPGNATKNKKKQKSRKSWRCKRMLGC